MTQESLTQQEKLAREWMGLGNAPLPPNPREKMVLCYSGGLDSTVLLYHLKLMFDVHAISVHYGQRHVKELVSASNICSEIGVRHMVVDLSHLQPIFAGSSQTDPLVPVPHGRYDEESMKLTVVPNRNMILLSVAAAWAISLKALGVAYAAHAGDHAIYPDCRREFVDAMRKSLNLCDWNQVALITPMININKGDIVRRGITLKVPFEKTWTCYEGKDVQCGKCGSCSERREAFQQAGINDPLPYETKRTGDELIHDARD